MMKIIATNIFIILNKVTKLHYIKFIIAHSLVDYLNNNKLYLTSIFSHILLIYPIITLRVLSTLGSISISIVFLELL